MHERISVNSLCFPTTPLEQVVDYWRAMAPSRVSIIAPQLTPDTVESVRAAVSGYKLEAISGHLFMPPLVTPDRESWAQARQRLDTMIDLAARVGAHSVYMLTGGHGTPTWEEAALCFSEAIAPCVGHAANAGIALAIENASVLFADTHIAHSLRDTVTLAEMAGIGVVIDIYGCWTEAGLHQTIERAIPRCELVQLSDYTFGDRAIPCRSVPGDGNVPLELDIGWMLNAGYQGAFDLELLGPRLDKEGHFEATRRATEWVTGVLQSLGA